MATPPFRQALHLWRTLVSQDLAARYRGTLLGRAWPVLMPLVMLAVYGFVFGVIFRARWPGLAEGDHLGFTLNLFAGLLLHGMMGETVAAAPDLLLRNANFVRKVVFPLRVLVAVPLGTALVHAAVGLGLLVVVNALFGSGLHPSVIALPLVLLPWMAMLFGLSLAMAALGVYIRDLSQIAGVLVMLVLFTGAVFFPRDMVPHAVSGIVDLNPLTWPVTAVRGALLLGHWPDPVAFAKYCAAAAAVLGLGWACFGKLRQGFADVL
jgi:lipopolysaccharide transport system permease protein